MFDISWVLGTPLNSDRPCKRESAMRDCWWEINPASGRTHPPVGTEALAVWAILWFVLRRVWGVRSPKHATALYVSSTGGVRVPQF
jgi:hypothetical protein